MFFGNASLHLFQLGQKKDCAFVGNIIKSVTTFLQTPRLNLKLGLHFPRIFFDVRNIQLSFQLETAPMSISRKVNSTLATDFHDPTKNTFDV